MKTIKVNAKTREVVGTKDAKKLRKEGMVPCVIYGGEAPKHFYADERELNKLVYTGDVYFVDIDLDGKAMKAVLREPQYHPITDRLIHMDFVELFDDKEVIMRLPVRLNGIAIGVKNGGVLRQNAQKLKVKALPGNIPECIEIPMEKMKIGMSVKVGELDLPDVTVMESDNRVIVAIKMARKAVVADDDEEGAGEEGAEGDAPAAEAAENAEA